MRARTRTVFKCLLFQELGIERREKEIAEGLYDQDGPEMLCGGCVWDPRYDFEQSEAFTNALKSTCELGFEKVIAFPHGFHSTLSVASSETLHAMEFSPCLTFTKFRFF